MIKILGRKQNMENGRWLEAMERIEELVPKAELAALVKKTKADIRKNTKGLKAAYCWSGGKDSIVLSDICRSIGIKDCMFAHTNLEYPAFMKWCMDHLPEQCEVICTGQDIEWLAKNPEMIFPTKSNYVDAWNVIVHRRAFTQYFFGHKLDVILMGHRKADGNFTGPGNYIRKKSGETRYSPLADWPHEMVLAYIHYHKLELPPIYTWKDGFLQGTHAWPSREHIESLEQGYREVYEIDPSIIVAAAEHIESARRFLKEVAGA